MPHDAYGEHLIAEVDRLTRLKVRCGSCNRLLAEKVTSPWVLRCPRCKAVNKSSA